MCQKTVLCLSTLKNCNWFFPILDPFFVLLSHNFASNGLLWVLYRKGSFVTHPGCPLPWLVGLRIPCRSRRSRQTYWLMDLHLALRPSYIHAIQIYRVCFKTTTVLRMFCCMPQHPDFFAFFSVWYPQEHNHSITTMFLVSFYKDTLYAVILLLLQQVCSN